MNKEKTLRRIESLLEAHTKIMDIMSKQFQVYAKSTTIRHAELMSELQKVKGRKWIKIKSAGWYQMEAKVAAVKKEVEKDLESKGGKEC